LLRRTFSMQMNKKEKKRKVKHIETNRETGKIESASFRTCFLCLLSIDYKRK